MVKWSKKCKVISVYWPKYSEWIWFILISFNFNFSRMYCDKSIDWNQSLNHRFIFFVVCSYKQVEIQNIIFSLFYKLCKLFSKVKIQKRLIFEWVFDFFVTSTNILRSYFDKSVLLPIISTIWISDEWRTILWWQFYFPYFRRHRIAIS